MRNKQITKLFPKEPNFRIDQISKALFNSSYTQWSDATNLPKHMTEKLSQEIPWLSIKSTKLLKNNTGDTYKAIVQGSDGKEFETVLMSNKRNQWTICVSSQVGCAMKCSFCATGTMGLKRSLSADEIIDQYRFWDSFVKNQINNEQRISNIVFMGMGEPLANYDALKLALNTLLTYTDLGETKITVSSVGILSQLNKILHDKDWPAVRLAISLHSANTQTRKSIVPTSAPDFLDKLATWGKAYNDKLGNRNHHITFEYILIKDINDSASDAKELAIYANNIGNVKINLIPYNDVTSKTYQPSTPANIQQFKQTLETNGITAHVRQPRGEDISGACGQLVISESKS